MRFIVALFITMLCGTAIAEKTPKKVEAKHLSDNRQIHAKPTIIFGNYGTTMGPSIALEIPIMKYFSLGGIFNAIFHFEHKSTILDFDAFFKARYPLRLGGYDAAVYGLMPIGFSFAVSSASTSPGFNFALLPGFAFYLERHWGIFTEFGLNYHTFGHNMAQGEFSIGVTYLF